MTVNGRSVVAADLTPVDTVKHSSLLQKKSTQANRKLSHQHQKHQHTQKAEQPVVDAIDHVTASAATPEAELLRC